MKDALDTVIAWQLRNPKATPEGAIEEVKLKQGELTSALVHCFLKLTIRPLFSKTRRGITAQGRKSMANESMIIEPMDNEEEKLWEDERILHLLKWCVTALDAELAQTHWPMIVPPIMTLLDETDTKNKILGCHLLENLLRTTPTAMLARTGLAEVFEQTVEPLLLYLPTLTPEEESIALLDAAYPALIAIVNARYPDGADQKRLKRLSLLLDQVLKSIGHVSDHSRLVSLLLVQVSEVVKLMGVDSVAQLRHVMPMLTSILSTPFPSLTMQAISTMQTVIANAWTRIWFWRGDVLKGVISAWTALKDINLRDGEGWRRQRVKSQLQTTIQMLVSAVKASDSNVDIDDEIRAIASEEMVAELFEKSGTKVQSVDSRDAVN